MQIEKLVLAAINVVRQAFGHGTFVDPNTMTTRTEADNNIHRYLADAPSINLALTMIPSRLMCTRQLSNPSLSSHTTTMIKSLLVKHGPGLC